MTSLPTSGRSRQISWASAKIAAKSDVKIETVIGESDAGSNIVGYTQNAGFDTTMIGRRGLGGFKEIVLGSISNKVLLHAKCSVMTAK